MPGLCICLPGKAFPRCMAIVLIVGNVVLRIISSWDVSAKLHNNHDVYFNEKYSDLYKMYL